jgi:putative ABC transport system permease protein
MRTVMAFWRRLAALVRRGRLDRDLDDELAFHLAMREAEYRAAGSTPQEARDSARRRFGNVTYLKEQARDVWTFHPIETLSQDVRYALRALTKSPGFTGVAVFALALGIGGNTAIFSVIDGVRQQALPYPHADRLVELWGNVLRTKVERRGASYPDFLDWRAQSTSFDAMAAFTGASAILSSGDEPERIAVEYVSAPYFSLLGVDAERGRTFQADEDAMPQKVAVVVLSDGLWKRRFGADPAVVGRQLRFGARAFTVVGVMPPGFKGLTDQAEAWMPFVMSGSPEDLAARGNRGFVVLARLKADVPIARAQSELDAISRRLEQAYPNTNSKRGVEVSALDVELFGLLRPALLTLMAAVLFVLLIACANVSNLLIARSEARQREIAVRTALGAGWPRLLRQLVTEGCVLTSLGAAAGLLLARAAIRLLLATSPVTFPSFVEPGINARVALFTIVVSLACGIVLGLAPAAHARVSRLADALKDSSRGSEGRRSHRLRSALVVAEVSLAVVLLVGAGLMIRSVQKLAALDPGFDPASVLTLRISVALGNTPNASPAASPVGPAVSALSVLERVRAVPGVAAASLVSDVPLSGEGAASFYSAEGQAATTAENAPRAYVHRVTPDFFATMRIPIKAGRTFFDSEMSRDANAVIVSERVVSRFWPGQDPIGKRIKIGSLTSNNPWLNIVGVVGETKYRALPENPTADPDLYFPHLDRSRQNAFVIRTSVPPSSVVPAVRAAIRSVDPTIPVFSVAPMAELVGQLTAPSRFTMWLMGVFAASALMLAVVGIYGVMSYLVTQRTREIGIRLALGADGGDILRLIVGNGARLIGAGVAIGVAASIALQRLVSTLLFGVTAVDASSVVAVIVLCASALVACYLPALRATRVDPLHALRYE